MAAKSELNVEVLYNSQTLTPYCNSAEVSAAIEQLEATNLDSTAKEYVTGFGEWSISIGGHWDATLDGYLAPDAVTPGTARTAYIQYSTNGGVAYVRYTWTSNAQIENYAISSATGSLISWTATLKLSGAPTRSTA
jgi:hypothetical protein